MRYMIIDKEKFDNWKKDPRSNLENFESGYLYKFGISLKVFIEKIKNGLSDRI